MYSPWIWFSLPFDVALQLSLVSIPWRILFLQIKNLKLANDVLKQARKKKQQAQQEHEKQVAQATEQAKVAADQARAEAEMQKQQALTASEVQFEQAKAQMEIQRLQTASQIKQQEMEIQHQYDMELKRMEVQAMQEKEGLIEDRKDKRIKMEGNQQSQMIDQRNNDLMPIDFEQQPGI